MKVLRLVCALCALVFLLQICAFAQAVNGTIVGTITDASGAVVPSAQVTITDTNTGTSRSATADANGYYTFPNLAPGTYTVKVQKEGFASAQQTGITLLVNSTARVDLTLQPGQVSQTVTVSTAPPLLQTDTARTGATLSAKQATQLPLGNGRNFQNLVNLVPGATPAQFNHSRFFNPQNSLNNQINGQSSLGNNYQIEGVNDNERTGLLQVYIPPVEAIQQMDVTTSNYDPEQGAAVGAVINIILKSGTNDFHGNVFEIWRGNSLDARNFFNYGPNGTKFVMPHLVYNYWGGALGGPIRKNKTFFFLDYLRTTDHEGQFQSLSVPTAAMKSGDFSDPALAAIYDPTTGNVADCLPGGNASNCGKGRTQFPHNMIPANRIDPVAARLLALLPNPNANQNLSGAQKYSNNYLESTLFTQDINFFDVKIDQYQGEKDHISGRLSYENPQTYQAPAFGPVLGGPIGGGFQGTSTDATWSAGINWDHILSPTLITEFRIGLNRYRNVAFNSDYGTNSSTQFGIPGVNVDPFTSGMTAFNGLSTFSTPLIGYSASVPWVRAETDFDIVDNWTKTVGNHTFKFGGNFIRIRDDLLQEQTFGPRGTWNFATGQTSLNGGPKPNFANNFAGLLLGVPSQVGRDLAVYFPAYRAWQLFFYGGDKWQVTPKLTLDLGLRWEFYPPATPQFRGGFSNYDGDRNTLVIAGVGGNPMDLGIQKRYKDFAPRIGVAYRVTSKDVIRAGFGISYEPFADNTYAYNYPVKQNNAFNNISSYGPALLPDGTPATYEKGFPPPSVASVPSNGLIPVNTPLLKNQSYITIAHNYVDPYVESWNFTYERALPKNVVLNVAYVGNRGVHIPLDYNLNATTDPAFIGKGAAGQPFNQRYGITSGVDLRYWQVASNYNSLQISAKRQFTGGLNLTTSYTFGKALGFGGENGENAPGAAYYVDFRRNYSRTDFDRTHIFTQSVIYELPFGPGRQFVKNGPLSYVVGGWRVTGVVTLMSGLPLNFGCTCQSINTPGNSQSPELVGSFQKLYGINTNPWFNTAAFADPTILFGKPTFGNVGRYILSGPGFFNFDAALFKEVRLTERFNLEFRTDWYSATNTPQFNNPNTNLGDANFGRITGAGGSRTIDIGLKLGF